MTPLNDLKSQAQHVAATAHRQLSETRSDRALHRGQAELLHLLKDQQQELKLLRREISRRHSGGFPWGLLLLVGAGYALYRTTPAVRDRMDALIGQLDPGVQGNLARAGDAVKDAVSDLGQGKNPTDAAGRAAGEVQRAGEKTAEQGKDTWQDLQDRARQTADDVTTGTTKGIA
ncbi:YtxH domain-containing protein [uncultured Deinococcus sp.]|uniref:YtxH domain-containing protein n=1 Tax=uncultured Deinococcus sp. TaxID=158789 RepID=UPI0025D964F8|nr:YtxH domain-containing protein [uncultured Deinococcus sp.]